MAKHNELGIWGEKIAKQFLVQKKYQILEQNWRWGKGEVDLIASYQNILIFIEVKTRSSSIFGHPEIFVSRKKERLLYNVAAQYMDNIQYESEFRFDIISIIKNKDNQPDIQHFEDAFFPTWN